MYTIKQAAARTGVAIPTIRAWERRYGVVDPARTAAGYRLYDEAAIERLAAMRFLVETEGWRPSQAAEHVKDPAVELASPCRGPSGTTPATSSVAPVRSGRPPDVAVEAFVAAAQRVDIHVMERVLDEAFASQRFELAMDEVVFPALRGIGRAWAIGELDVAAEHAASETVRRRLARFFDAARGGGDRPQVLVGMPPAGHHELGAFAFAVACRRAGLEVLYLGADVPLESWLRTVRETAVPAVVLGAVATRTRPRWPGGRRDPGDRSTAACFAVDPPPSMPECGRAPSSCRPSSTTPSRVVRATVERAEGRSPVA